MGMSCVERGERDVLNVSSRKRRTHLDRLLPLGTDVAPVDSRAHVVHYYGAGAAVDEDAVGVRFDFSICARANENTGLLRMIFSHKAQNEEHIDHPTR